MTRLTGRAVLGGALGLAGGGLLGLPGCASPSADQTARMLPSAVPLPERFRAEFVVPPVKEPVSRTPGASAYEIVQRRASLSLLPGLTTQVMGYDGLLPGPTIRTRRGERVTVTHRNRLH